MPLEQIDFGGGLGISYDGAPVPDAGDYVRALVAAAGDVPLALAIEPGRSIVGPAGVLLTTVVDVKHVPGGRRFVVLDAGMTELMRPALYGAFHRIEPARPRPGAAEAADVVGPICESTDRFARDRALPPLEVGDLVAIRDVGAYGAVLGSTYLRRPLPPEALVDGDTWTTIRRRQTLDDLLRSRRRSGMTRGRLIAFEGLDQSGKQTQAEWLRDGAARRRARACRLVSFPDYHDDHRRRDRRRRCRASAPTAPTCCSCSTSPTATSTRRRIRALAGRRRDGGRRSLCGVEPGLRRGAGPRRGVARPTSSGCCRRPT